MDSVKIGQCDQSLKESFNKQIKSYKSTTRLHVFPSPKSHSRKQIPTWRQPFTLKKPLKYDFYLMLDFDYFMPKILRN